MRPRMLTAVAAGALTLSLLGPTAPAGADPREDPGPALPEQASTTAHERAEAALERAQALIDDRPHAEAGQPRGGREATMILNQLVRARPDLTASEREQAEALLARPTKPGGDGLVDYRVREAKPHCGGAICVHFVRRTADAPPRADADRDRVPNAVEQTLQIARHVHGTYVDAGYRRPDPDGKRGGRRNKVDIYLADLGDQGLYGYCTSDQPQKFNGTKNYWAYCAIDEDFSKKQFPSNTPQENRKVTLAHEYYHAVQFAYDSFEDSWFMESTATWVEDEVYDGINDNWQYLDDGQLGKPYVPLDSRTGVYGNWLYFRYLTERWPAETGSLPTLPLMTWRKASGRAGAPDLSSVEAVTVTLEELGATFAGVYGDFAVANRDPDPTYSEGAAYEKFVADPLHRHTLSSTRRMFADDVTLDHLSSDTVKFTPGPDLTEPTWNLTVDVDLPGQASNPLARLIVHHADGTATPVQLAPTGTGSVAATISPFTTSDVTDVELVVGNASASLNRRTTSYTATLTQSP